MEQAAAIKQRMLNYFRLRLLFLPLLALFGDNDSLIFLLYPRRNHLRPRNKGVSYDYLCYNYRVKTLNKSLEEGDEVEVCPP